MGNLMGSYHFVAKMLVVIIVLSVVESKRRLKLIEEERQEEASRKKNAFGSCHHWPSGSRLTTTPDVISDKRGHRMTYVDRPARRITASGQTSQDIPAALS
jgi:hypothetical protein